LVIDAVSIYIFSILYVVQVEVDNAKLDKREESLDLRDETLKAKEDKLRGVLNG